MVFQDVTEADLKVAGIYYRQGLESFRSLMDKERSGTLTGNELSLLVKIAGNMKKLSERYAPEKVASNASEAAEEQEKERQVAALKLFKASGASKDIRSKRLGKDIFLSCTEEARSGYDGPNTAYTITELIWITRRKIDSQLLSSIDVVMGVMDGQLINKPTSSTVREIEVSFQ